MMIRSSLAYTVCTALLTSVANAQKVGVRSQEALACWNAALKWDFGCDISENACLCSNQPFLGTILTCARARMEDEVSISHAYQYIQNYCKYNAQNLYSFGSLESIYFNATLYAIEISNATMAMNKNEILFNPVDTENSLFETQFRAAYAAKRQYDLGTTYGYIMIFYWLCVGVVGSTFNYLLQKYPELIFRQSPTMNKIRKHLILPATFRGSHSRPVKLFMNLYLSAPTRGQSLILLGYFVLNIVLVLINYDVYDQNPYLTTTYMQYTKYIGNRTGIIAFTQLPLVILFAARNDVFISWTGWSYATMQIYHRWCARIMMMHAFVHSACFTAFAVNGHTIAYRWQEVINWRFGNIATYSGVIMVLMAFNAFRSRFYDVFYFFHKVFYVTFMIGLFRHCWDFGWMGWIYASLAIHGLERGARLFNTILSGWKNTSYAELYDDNTFKVSVKYSHRWELEPGQYCYLRILHKNLFWQAHPFSVYRSPHDDDSDIHFAIKAHNGATGIIRDYLASQSTRSAELSCMIEGPYGHRALVEKYSTVFLIAGGTGVTATYSYALYLKNLAKRGQKVVFIWVIQNPIPLEWFGEELLALMNLPNFELQIYITRNFQPRIEESSDSDSENDSTDVESFDEPRRAGSPSQKLKEKSSEKTLRGSPSMQKMLPAEQIQDQFSHLLFGKRPDIKEELTKFLKSTQGNMCVVSCGPPILVDNIRQSIVSNLEEPNGRVDYYEEAFSW